ncbi:MAG: hypothetical protein NTX33_16395 [Propionibacteriales bacterium]|nr:hypothetical protein [Propionibacteriales bacterium]
MSSDDDHEEVRMHYFFCTVSDPWSDFAFLGMVANEDGFDYVTSPRSNLDLDPVQRIDAFVNMSGRDASSLTLSDFKMIATRSVPMQRVSSWIEVETFDEAQEAILRALAKSDEQRVLRRLEGAQGRVSLAYDEASVWAADADDPADLWSAGQLQDFVLDAVADRRFEGPNGWLVRKQMGLAPEPGDELGFVRL